ncbi:unnamed protein product [Echinostoma caproni]|uniref:DUF5641 domain-containing protein n=1 Tax=Echinostoma caproni TaxID=27848 RepID=A0A183BBR1_9TREM|nr:unnamed protein product [Echinostoma caproni]
MIRSVRRILLAVCNQQSIDDETLNTALIEVERILNNRPLTPVASEAPGLALTPNDLMLLRPNNGLTVPRTLTKYYSSSWRQATYLAGVFWKRWVREYLPTLQARQKWLLKERNFRVGDIVLLADERLRRDEWPLAIIEECLPDEDGLVRTVKVRTAAGETLRDIRRICYLEGDEAEATENPSS